MGSRPYEFPNNVHVSVTYELDLDLTVIDRQAYSVLDWLGDIGGLTEAIFFISGTFLILFNYRKFESMMVSYLFLQKETPPRRNRSLQGAQSYKNKTGGKQVT